MKRHSIVCLAFLLGIMLCGCQTQMEKVSEMEEQTLQSSINKDNCYIRGTPAGGLLEYYYKFPERQNKQNVTDIVVDNVINSQSYNSASYK